MSGGRDVEAFEEYFKLTSTGCRTKEACRRVADKFGVSLRTVFTWKKKGAWDVRCTERSVAVNRNLVEKLRQQSDKYVEDFRKPFVEILDGLIDNCITAGDVQVANVKELLACMELSVRLQKELDMGNVPVVSAEYSREKHIDEINGLLGKLKERDERRYGLEAMDGEGEIRETKIVESGQADIRVDGS